ncbi:MAG TPA: DNA polymerase III subunit beta [Candidatus Binatia bacterium]|nr:DNA polymerase III subunit beta [Candidatus Binatia bacterium]
MEFSVDRGEFLEGLALTQGVVERRNTLPILANALLDASGKDLAIAATDLEVHVKRRVRAKLKKPGTATVAARKFYEFVRELKPGEVTVRLLENHFVEVTAGRSRVKLVGLPASDFPAFPQPEGKAAATFEVPCADLARMIDCTLFAVSTDETRPHLGGVLLALAGGALRFVGTDGHRLALFEQPLANAPGEAKSAILPRKGLVELRKILEGAEGATRVAVGASVVRVQHDDVELVMRLIEGEFPNYEQVIPKSSKHTISVDKNELLSALRRVSVVASDRARGVKIQVSPGQLVVAANSPDFGEASEEIEIAYSGEELAVGFNSRYLMDVLTVLADDHRVEIGLSDDASPGVIQSQDDETYRYVVMPMRL